MTWASLDWFQAVTCVLSERRQSHSKEWCYCTINSCFAQKGNMLCYIAIPPHDYHRFCRILQGDTLAAVAMGVGPRSEKIHIADSLLPSPARRLNTFLTTMLLLIVVVQVESSSNSAETRTGLSADNDEVSVVADARTWLRGVFVPKAAVIYRRDKAGDNGRRSVESTVVGRQGHRYRDMFLRCQQVFDTSGSPTFLE